MSGQMVSNQDHKTAFPIWRIVGEAVVNDMLCSLHFATFTGRRRSFRQNCPVPVRRRLSLTLADLGSLVSSVVEETFVCVESGKIIFPLLVSCVVQSVCCTDVEFIASS